jgi:hypothetical protein
LLGAIRAYRSGISGARALLLKRLYLSAKNGSLAHAIHEAVSLFDCPPCKFETAWSFRKELSSLPTYLGDACEAEIPIALAVFICRLDRSIDP